MASGSLDSLTIGVPRALYYYLYPGLFETFLRELGARVVVSAVTNPKTVERAGLVSEAEHCLPVKMLDSHLAALASETEMVLVPRILSSLPGHIACPKLGALPDSARAQFGDRTEVLSVDIDEARIPLEASLVELGKKLSVRPARVEAATRAAREAMRLRRRAAGAGRGSGQRRLLLLGHPYNVNDPYFAGPILRKLEALGVGIDVVDFAVGEASVEPIRWDASSIMYDTLARLDGATCAGVIQLSSFSCGCDSMSEILYRGLLREKRIPQMTLVLDGHSALAGIDTRLEAFVDSIGW